jgi:aminobenzoyl-glutamate transport protein
MFFLFLPVIWYVTDRIIEPRLGTWDPARAGNAPAGEQTDRPLTADERKGLKHAGLAVLGVCALWLFFAIGPGTPLIDEEAAAEAQLTPFYQSLVAGFFLLFLLAGWAYGRAVGLIGNHRDLVKMMSGAMEDLAYYLVLAFAAAHFVAMFGWSNLGLIMAVNGADFLGNSGMPAWALLASIVIVSGLLNLLVGSASAKWALLSPVLVPMLLLLGISPEMATAAYRVGDSATNIITPLMVCFPLILIFCQRWQKDFGMGSLMATMLPYSMGLLVMGVAMTIGWVALDLPLGPGASVFTEIPTAQVVVETAP